MKTKMIKLFEVIFGTKNNLVNKFGIASLISGMILSLAAFLYSGSSPESDFFTYASAFCLVIWILITRGMDSAGKICFELLRLLVFFPTLIASLFFCYNAGSHHGKSFYVHGILSCFGIFICAFYFVAKLSDMFRFIKDLCKRIKNSLYDSVPTSTSKPTALIENITAFLIAIGGLTLAIKAITETVFQILEHFN